MAGVLRHSAGVSAAQSCQTTPSRIEPAESTYGTTRQPNRVARSGIESADRKLKRMPRCGMRSESARSGPGGIQARSIGPRPGTSGIDPMPARGLKPGPGGGIIPGIIGGPDLTVLLKGALGTFAPGAT